MMSLRLAATGAALALSLAAATAAPGYHLQKSVTLGGDTFWDAITLDAANHHLFITHGTHVVVVDSRTMRSRATSTASRERTRSRSALARASQPQE